VFFDCDQFTSNGGMRKNQYGMVEVKHEEQICGDDTKILAHRCEQVYYMSYPCRCFNDWWVVYKVNPCERLYGLSDAVYSKRQIEMEEGANENFRDDELPSTFNIDIEMLEEF
jgi:hypothetical protein